MHTMTDQYLTPSELARIWNVHVDKIYDLIQSGELPAVDLAVRRKVPRYRIRQVDIEAFELGRTTTKPVKPQRRQKAVVAPDGPF